MESNNTKHAAGRGISILARAFTAAALLVFPLAWLIWLLWAGMRRR